jgi:hypothetical protein
MEYSAVKKKKRNELVFMLGHPPAIPLLRLPFWSEVGLDLHGTNVYLLAC